MGFAALRCLSHRSLARSLAGGRGRESRERSAGRGREGGQVRDAAAEAGALPSPALPRLPPLRSAPRPPRGQGAGLGCACATQGRGGGWRQRRT